MLADRRGRLLAVELKPRSRRDDRGPADVPPAGREPGKDDAKHQGHEREPADRRHQQGAGHGQPAAEVNVVAEEPGGAPVESPGALDEAVAVRFDLGDVVIGTNRDRAERPRVSVRHALVVHRDVEEAGGGERLAAGLDFFQVPSERLFTLVETEDRLEGRRPGWSVRGVMDERIVEAVTDRPLERLMEDAPPVDAVQLAQLGFEPRNVSRLPLLDRRSVDAAELRQLEHRPRSLRRRRGRCDQESVEQAIAKLRYGATERELLDGLVE